jgi:hypothetical protein
MQTATYEEYRFDIVKPISFRLSRMYDYCLQTKALRASKVAKLEIIL